MATDNSSSVVVVLDDVMRWQALFSPLHKKRESSRLRAGGGQTLARGERSHHRGDLLARFFGSGAVGRHLRHPSLDLSICFRLAPLTSLAGHHGEER
jgi:hypothetical protein